MKSIFVYSLFIMLFGCGKHKSKANNNAPAETTSEDLKVDVRQALLIEDASKIPACTADAEGWLIYVKPESAFKACLSGAWTVIDIKGEKGDAGPKGDPGKDATIAEDSSPSSADIGPISYNSWVEGWLKDACLSCHAGTYQPDLTTYSNVRTYANAVLSDIKSGRMPQDGAHQDSDVIQKFQTWIAQGMPGHDIQILADANNTIIGYVEGSDQNSIRIHDSQYSFRLVSLDSGISKLSDFGRCYFNQDSCAGDCYLINADLPGYAGADSIFVPEAGTRHLYWLDDSKANPFKSRQSDDLIGCVAMAKSDPAPRSDNEYFKAPKVEFTLPFKYMAP